MASTRPHLLSLGGRTTARTPVDLSSGPSAPTVSFLWLRPKGTPMLPRPVVDLVVSWPDDPQMTVQLWHHHGSQETSSMVRVTGESHCSLALLPRVCIQAQNHSHPAFILRKWRRWPTLLSHFGTSRCILNNPTWGKMLTSAPSPSCWGFTFTNVSCV